MFKLISSVNGVLIVIFGINFIPNNCFHTVTDFGFVVNVSGKGNIRRYSAVAVHGAAADPAGDGVTLSGVDVGGEVKSFFGPSAFVDFDGVAVFKADTLPAIL